MPQQKIHGIVSRTRNLPGNVVNIRSKKIIQNNTIKLDKLLLSDHPRILIKRRLGGIGDVIMSTPLLKKIKKIIPHCELTYATDLKYSNGALGEIIKHNPYVDVLLGNGEPKESEYDYVVDITTTGLGREKSGSIPPNRIDMFAEEVGINVYDDPVPDYVVNGDEREKAKVFLKEIITNTKKKVIAIQARSNDARRTWPLDYVQQLADLLSLEEKYFILLFDWGSSIDRWIGNDNLFIVKDLPFQDTMATIEQVDLVICPDSSMLHMAGALNKKIVSIFGPIPAQSRINYYSNATAIQLRLACSNCWYSTKCNSHTGSRLECLTKISPDMVKKEVDKRIMEPDKTLSAIIYGQDLTNKGQDSIIFIKRTCGGLGDILMLTPGIKALKEKYPDKDVHLAIPKQYFPIVENLPFINQLVDVTTPQNNKRYFISADLSNPCARYEYARISAGKKVEKSRIEVFAEALGVRSLLAKHIPEYNVSKEEKDWATGFLGSQKLNKNKKTIAINLSSAEIYRDYPKDKQDKLTLALSENYNVIALGTERTGEAFGAIDACGFPIRKWAAILSQCDAFITVDTGPLHVAAALNLPTIALFGPIDYNARCKGYNNVTVIISNLECIPCWRNAVIKCKQTDEIKGNSRCLELIPIKSILEILKTKV